MASNKYDDDDDGPRNRRSTRRASRDDSSDVPYRDADTDIGEIPIDELDTFVVAATDDRGIGEHVHFRMPPYVRRQIKILLNSGRFPYLSESDLIRHAIVRHIYWLASLRNSIPKHISPSLAAILEVCRDESLRIQVEAAFQKIEERANFHLGRGDHAEVIRLLNLVKRKLAGVQPSAWQRQILEHFNATWSGYLQGQQIVDVDRGVQ